MASHTPAILLLIVSQTLVQTAHARAGGAGQSRRAALPPAAYQSLKFGFPDIDAGLEGDLLWDESVSFFPGEATAQYVHAGLLTFENLGAIMEKGQSVYLDDTPIVRGKDYEGLQLTAQNGWDLQIRGTTIVHDVDKRWKPVRRKCAAFTEGFGCTCSATAVVTPPETASMQHHMNKHDTFVLQLSGHKKFSFYDSVEASFLPRRDQAKERYTEVRQNATNPSKAISINLDAPTRVVTLRPGDILYIPRGVVHMADTLQSDEPSLHVSFCIQCADDRSIWEEILHNIIAMKSLRDKTYEEPVEKFTSPLPEYRVKYAAVFHVLLRVLSNAMPLLRKSCVGIVGSTFWVKNMLESTVLPQLRDAATLVGFIDPDDVRVADTSDPRFIMWAMSGVEKPHDVESGAQENQIILDAVKEYIADISGKGHRTIGSVQESFFALFLTMFESDTVNSAVVDTIASQRGSAIAKHLRAANTHVTRHAELREDPHIW